METLEKKAAELLAKADIEIGGSRPWDLTVHDERFFSRVFREGSLGLGESYMDGWWDVPALDEFFTRIFQAGLNKKQVFSLPELFFFFSSLLLNRQSKRRAFQVGERHYDIGNDLYQAMLDKRLVYTCGYWKDTDSLNQAQEAKLDLVCRKLGLRPGQKVLDIGCGWGSFARFAAERYGVEVVGITISQEQAALARELCAGLPVEIRLEDYRETSGAFDHIVSLGMFEHVGSKNYRTYMETASRLLKRDGRFLLHTIGSNTSVRRTDSWLDRYIFPNGMLPSTSQIGKSIEGLFVMEDWHNFGADYDKTLMAWHRNFEAAWPELQKNYRERFRRMWKYYLLSCAASFRARKNQLWQIILSKEGIPGGYTSLR
ncbi:MAG: cyclopropane-fatty-acyl-phospholipid synthase [Candidatus Moranbacteria bacterium RIFCSPHIGHO2_01_FULL_55_24]|nr:MAG: cyclopropane-fatty-acyl-phospholipid synthase [Candidatus Moranbacteria bacterium RIFCSPHIGHO2_01_FULL_55_24]